MVIFGKKLLKGFRRSEMIGNFAEITDLMYVND